MKLRRTLKLALLACCATRVAMLLTCTSPRDVPSRLEYLTKTLADPKAGWAPSEFYRGEWRMGAESMTALALLDSGRAAEAPALAERVLRTQARAFDTGQYGTDALETLDTAEGHAGYLGHLGLVLSVECLGGAPRALGGRVAAALRRRFLAAPDGLVQTYPGLAWVPDNAAALAAVELDAKCRGLPSIAFVAQRWPRDPGGLFKFTPTASARGSGAGFIGLYLAFIDRELARQQWALAKARFGVAPLPGFFALREWPRGVGRGGDMDSGPVLFGLSPSGTGFAIGAAAAAGDLEAAAGMARTAELAGFTLPFGGRHFLVGPLVGDASVTAGLSLALPGAQAAGAAAHGGKQAWSGGPTSRL
jgi:hypothetical protein